LKRTRPRQRFWLLWAGFYARGQDVSRRKSKAIYKRSDSVLHVWRDTNADLLR
jgi:hypothetical protein